MTYKHLVMLCLLTIFCLTLTLFLQLNIRVTDKKKPFIVCTTTIIADAVKNIGKDSLDIICLMGPGIDPHIYKPVESDVMKIASADIIFYNGLHLEAKMADLFKHLAKKQTTVAITKDIPESMLLAVDDYHNIFDPHVWFDIHLWIYAAQTICQILIEKFPEHETLYQKNTADYITQLKELLLTTQTIMKTIPEKNRVLISGHDAFSYFGRVYDCKVIGLQGISTESSPGIYDLTKIIYLICQKQIPAIFIESSIPVKNIIAIQQGVACCNKKVNLGGQLFSDALGPQNSSGDSYINMMLHNVQTIAQALQ